MVILISRKSLRIKSNNLLAAYHDFFSRSGKDAVKPYVAPPPSGLTATGGFISDYEVSGTYYRAHIFTSPGDFDASPGTLGDTIEIFAIGGGGGGSGGFPGYGPGRGGGGGSFVVTSYPVSVATYPIGVGVGGGGVTTGPASSPFATGRGIAGGSTFTNPSSQVLTTAGGGGGGDYDAPSSVAPNSSGGPGGCGGGGGGYPGASFCPSYRWSCYSTITILVLLT